MLKNWLVPSFCGIVDLHVYLWKCYEIDWAITSLTFGAVYDPDASTD